MKFEPNIIPQLQHYACVDLEKHNKIKGFERWSKQEPQARLTFDLQKFKYKDRWLKL